MKKSAILFFWFFGLSCAFAEDKWINPLTDVCWGCLFPIHVAGANVSPSRKDFVRYPIQPFCSCAGTPPKLGIPLAFWEPVAIIDVTRSPYKLIALGGTSIAKADVRKRGMLSHGGDAGRSSFYNVHYYQFPILHWLGLLTDFPCLEASDLSVPYLSEFDPFWDDDEWSSVLNPEVFLFANPIAQAACLLDCVESLIDQPDDKLFWCAGCVGSLYPFVGHVAHHIGGVQASYLLVQRLLAKLHSLGMGWGFQEGNFCEKTLLPRIKKTIYKTQLIRPVANTKAPCQPLGKSDALWGSGKNYPYGGEDFAYLIWIKKHCCLDAVKPVSKALAGVDYD